MISTVAKPSGAPISTIPPNVENVFVEHYYDVLDNDITLIAIANVGRSLQTYLQFQTVQVRVVTLLADIGNTDTVLVGSTSAPKYPLTNGASIDIHYCDLSKVFLGLKTGTANQVVHYIAGGW